MLAISTIEMYARLLMALLFVVPAICLVVIAALIVVKWQLWRIRRRRAERQAREVRFRPDGEPYPPSKRGMCDACAKAFEKVYYLPAGRRLCPDCYEGLQTNAGAVRPTAPQ